MAGRNTRTSRTSRNKGRVVSVDFTNVEEGGGGSFHIKPGPYLMKVKKAEEHESDAGNDNIKFTCEGLEKAAKGKTFYLYCPLVDNSLWKLRSFLEALGQEVPKSEMDIDLESLEDLEFIGIVEDDEYKNKTVSRLNDFESTDGASGEEEEEGEDEEKPAARGKGTKKTAGKGKKLDKISADEVKAMDEEELGQVIEKYDLEVDLSEHKTARRKATAVVTALEEAEMLEDA